MRLVEPKPDSRRVEPFPRVTRSLQVFILVFEAGEVFVEGIVMRTVHDVGQLRRENVICVTIGRVIGKWKGVALTS